jgi:hypothetical protein
VPGHLTWHLYASHPGMEHRRNRAQEIAARSTVGARVSKAFSLFHDPILCLAICTTTRPGDKMNFRAPFTRTVPIWEAQKRRPVGYDAAIRVRAKWRGPIESGRTSKC